MTVKQKTDGCDQHSELAASRLPIILAIDTSSPRLGLAIARGAQMVAAFTEESSAPHSQTLFPNLARLLESAQLDPSNIDAFAVATGPGSFTGLRVGLATVKGLARTLERAAIGITSLDGLALASGAVGYVVAMIDAGRREVYCGLREVSASGEVKTVGEDRVGSTSVVLASLPLELNDAPLVFVGEGARHYRDELAAAAAQAGTHLQITAQMECNLASWQLRDEQFDLAPHIALHAGRLFNAGTWPEAHAYYIRPSDAELKCR